MPKDVVDRVHVNRNLLFAWRDGTPVKDPDHEDDEDDADDPDWDPASASDSDSEEEDSVSDDDDDNDIYDDNYAPDALDIPIAGVLAEGNEEGNY
jgi:hypothetical protein